MLEELNFQLELLLLKKQILFLDDDQFLSFKYESM